MTTMRGMLDNQLRARGLHDPRVLAAMAAVPREQFVAPEQVALAYEDAPLSLPEGQTISQPYIVALMLVGAELGSTDRVLEIGTGSGYSAAVTSQLAAEVHTVERHASLAHSARERLARLGYPHVHVHQGDGSRGWPDQAPYDAILVTAGGPSIPPSLQAQLAPGGRLVMPVGQLDNQRLLRVLRTGENTFQTRNLGRVRFVPLVGAEGW